MNNKIINDILEAREKRAELVGFLTSSYNKPLLTIRVNYPGINKDNETSEQILAIVEKHIYEFMKERTAAQIKLINSDGPASFLIFDDDYIKVKKKCIEYEDNSILGRCVDIDVYNEKGEGISRSNLGMDMRKCFICGDIAHVCVRNRRHGESEIIEFINDKLNEYVEINHDKKI